MPWAPLMMMPGAGQLYDTMSQAYAGVPRADDMAYAQPVYVPPVVPDPGFGETFVGPMEPRAPQPPVVSNQFQPMDSTTRQLLENEYLLRAIYANANL